MWERKVLKCDQSMFSLKKKCFIGFVGLFMKDIG